jgi:ABC-type dipeptide/oligopeptide/nickel transport system ATPase component
MPINKKFGTDWQAAINKVEPPTPIPDGKYAPKWPFRAIICGPSGSGKTFTLLSMLMGDDTDCQVIFEEIHICTKNFDEPAYKILTNGIKKSEDYLRQQFATRRIKGNIQIGHYYTDPMELMGLINNMDDTTRKIFVFDDMELNQGGAAGKVMEEFFQRCRKKNASVVFIAQTYYGTNKFIRRNANYKFIFKPTGKREVDCLAGDIATDGDDFRQIAEKIWAKPRGWVQILPNGELREGFYPISDDEASESSEEANDVLAEED